MFGLLLPQGNLGGIERRIISADLINEAPVTRRARISYNYSIKRFFSAAMTAQPDH
jgi:hypothetical protein